jgi:hypothetical protein
MPRAKNPLVDWKLAIPEADRVARSYSTPVTLRQLHYRLVSSGVGGYLNIQAHYKGLSRHTARLRRVGAFPALLDTTRGVNRPMRFDDPDDAIDWVKSIYRRDRTENQSCQTWVIFEKATLAAQIESWTDEMGLPTAALRGYSSESLEREAIREFRNDGRPVVVFYVGDLDPEGEDIERNFQDQAMRQGVTFKHWERLGILPAHEARYGLVPQFGKAGSSRAKGFIAKYGRLFQIETEALDPGVLETLVTRAVKRKRWFDQAVFEASKQQEQDDKDELDQR